MLAVRVGSGGDCCADAPDAKILYMSGYASEPTRSDVLPGAVLIEKPFDPETLLRAVRESLDGVRAASY